MRAIPCAEGDRQGLIAWVLQPWQVPGTWLIGAQG